MSLLQVSGVSKKEAGNFVLKDISFSQNQLQKIAIAGETGSGKSTLLKIIAGIVQPDNGHVLFENEKVKGPQEQLIAGHPQIGYHSQYFELRNHYRVEELLQMANQLQPEEAEVIFEVCRITHLLKRFTSQLSGGERQRIALAKLLVTNPSLLLLDEPYSNLDAIHKSILKTVITDISETLNYTCILVSHDPSDLLSWADEIMVLKDGVMVQRANPGEIYREPVNDYVAALFGPYTILNPSLAKAFSEFTDLEMNRINSFMRPCDFKIAENGTTGVRGVIRKMKFMGGFYELEVSLAGSCILVHTNHGNLKEDDVVYISI